MKNNDPLISIVTPLYNCEKYIKETIESVVLQSYTNWEMIIIDDCSTDNSIKIITEYTRSIPNIRILRNKQNVGVAETRNIGIREAKGEYIAFLDSDDTWKFNKLQNQLAFMIENDIEFSFSNYDVIDKDNVKLGDVNCNYDKLDFNLLLKKNYIPCLTVMIKSKILKKYRLPKIRHEDYALWLDILEDNIYAYNVGENLANYRKLDSSLSSNKIKSAIWTWNIFRNYKKLSFFKSCICFINYIFRSIFKFVTL